MGDSLSYLDNLLVHLILLVLLNLLDNQANKEQSGCLHLFGFGAGTR